MSSTAPEQPPADFAGTLAARLKTFAGIVAPTTLFSALLLYFGYIATLARFRYFGVYLDLIGFSNQQMLLFGVEALFVPITLIGVVSLLLLGFHAAVGSLLSNPARRDIFGGWLATGAIMAATVLLLRGLVGILVPSVSIEEYPGTTPLALVMGAFLGVYGAWTARRMLRERRPGASRPGASRPGANRRGAKPEPYDPDAWYERPLLVRGVLTGATVVAVAGLFWAANSFASAYGSGRALDDAVRLIDEPEVILETKQRLTDLPPEIARTEATLPTGPDEAFRYRYRGMRLLASADDRLFLIPARWSDTGRTVILPYDSEIRLQLDP